jgi:hypothetical protein
MPILFTQPIVATGEGVTGGRGGENRDGILESTISLRFPDRSTFVVDFQLTVLSWYLDFSSLFDFLYRFLKP